MSSSETTMYAGQAIETVAYLKYSDRKFRRACQQVLLLNNQIADTQVHYDRAVNDQHRTYRYTLRLRLATLEGIRNMYHDYAVNKADELDELQDRLIEAGLLQEETEDIDSEDSESGEDEPMEH